MVEVLFCVDILVRELIDDQAGIGRYVRISIVASSCLECPQAERRTQGDIDVRLLARARKAVAGRKRDIFDRRPARRLTRDEDILVEMLVVEAEADALIGLFGGQSVHRPQADLVTIAQHVTAAERRDVAI